MPGQTAKDIKKHEVIPFVFFQSPGLLFSSRAQHGPGTVISEADESHLHAVRCHKSGALADLALFHQTNKSGTLSIRENNDYKAPKASARKNISFVQASGTVAPAHPGVYQLRPPMTRSPSIYACGWYRSNKNAAVNERRISKERNLW